MHMDAVPDTCLEAVFAYCDVVERLRLEQVCRRWRGVMPYSDIRTVQLAQLPWPQNTMHDFPYKMTQSGEPSRMYAVHPASLRNALEHLLSRVCRHVQKLSFEGKIQFILTRQSLDTIAFWCPLLDTLVLNRTLLKDAGQCFAAINELQNLQHLSLANVTYVTDQNVRVCLASEVDIIAAYTGDMLMQLGLSLRALNLERSLFCPTINCAALEKLWLNRNECMHNQHLLFLCEHCPNLRELYLNACRQISDFTPISKLIRLESLEVQGTIISADHLEQITQHCTALQRLQLSQCPRLISFASLRYLGGLRVIHIGPTRNFDDDDLCGLAFYGLLEHVCVRECRNLTDRSILSLAEHCSSLQELHITGLVNVTDDALARLLEYCPKLVVLSLDSTNITNTTLSIMGHAAIKLTKLTVENCSNLDEHGFRSLANGRLRLLSLGIALPKLDVHVGGATRMNPISGELTPLFASANVNLIRRHVRTPWVAQGIQYNMHAQHA